MCILKITSKSKSFKTLSKKTKIPVFSIYEKGDFRNSKKKEIRTDYRISFDVSEKEWDDFSGQVEDAIRFLSKYQDELLKIFQSHEVDYAYLDFPIWSRLNSEIVNQNDHLPNKLISLAGNLNLGIEMSIYSTDAFEKLSKNS